MIRESVRPFNTPLVWLLFVVAGASSAGWPKTTIFAPRAQIKTVSYLLEEYKASVGRYPSTEEGLEALVERPEGVDPAAWKGPYLTQLPKDPWGHPYTYRCPGRNNRMTFDIYSMGRDGKSSSDGNDKDDINNWDADSGDYYHRKNWTPYLIGVGAGVVVIAVSCVYIVRKRKSSASHSA